MQLTVYANLHDRHHGLVYMSVMLVNGFFLFFGPYQGKEHDSTVFKATGVIEKLQAMKVRTQKRWILFGDSAFARGEHVQRMFKGAWNNPDRTMYNKRMASMRICVEWGFGGLKNLFPYIRDAASMKLGSAPVGRIFSVAAFLKNCHNAAYGELTGAYCWTPEP